jgi:phosphoglycerol transferase MdoB-like AlkP superfamily enzyme
MNWIQKNFKTIIYLAFLVPIITVAIVSISHVTKWYGISNPISWSIYLSVGIEIAALSALAAISAQMGKKVYFPFAIVTLIQFLGNIFFAYSYIDVNSQSFKDWVDLSDPIVQFLGVESGDMIGHKRFLALFAGGMLPLISLSFLHMLVKFEEEEKKKDSSPQPINEPVEESESFDKIVESAEEYNRLLEVEMKKLNEAKFDNLTETQVPDNDSSEDKKTKRVLSYSKRDG